MRNALTLAAAAAVLSTAGLASGQTVNTQLFDAFNTGIGDADTLNPLGLYADAPLSGQDPVGILGESDATTWGGNSGNLQADLISLTHDATGYAVASTGKSVILGVSGDTSLTRFQNRGLTVAGGNTLYYSGIINRGSGLGTGDVAAPVNDGSFALMGFYNFTAASGGLDSSAGGNLFGLGFGFGGDDAGNYDIIVRHRHNPSGTGAVGSDIGPFNETILDDADANTNYLVILKSELNANSPDAGRGNDAISYWIGAEGNGFDVTSEATMSATADASGVLASYGFNTASDIQRLILAQNSYEATSAFFDEARLGTTLDSVTTVIPEPASLGLLGMAGLGLMRRRK